MTLLHDPFFIFISLLFVGSADFVYSDGNSGICPEPWFRCDSGICLSEMFVCDGQDDCLDGTDESNCSNILSESTYPDYLQLCDADEYQCANYDCIPLRFLCDGQQDCSDGSDEYAACMLQKACNDFRCKNGNCIKNDWVCDGIDNCSDLSDETNCDNRTTVPQQCNNQIDRFLCFNGKCISLNKTCDGNNDCDDNSDEHMEGCINDKIDCKDNSEVCDHRCINTAGTYYCICDEGYEIQNDTKTCEVKYGDALLIFSAKNSIRGLYLQSEIYFPISRDLKHAVGVSMHADYIYWLDIKKGEEAIVRTRTSDSKPEVIVTSGLGLTEEIAVDWITGNIYFTDSLYKHIGVCNNDGSQCTTIISGASDMLRGLALYPQNGQMFWSDFGENPHISTAGMDGREDKPLITENLAWPNGLAIDYPKRRLYWVDAKREVIESVRLDGTDRKQVLHTTSTHPYSIAIFANKMYWSDWETKSIQSADKSSGNNRTTLIREVDTIYGIHIHHSVLEPMVSNPCENQPCSQLCLLAINRTYSCACTLDHELNADGYSCNSTRNTDRLLISAGNTLIEYHHAILGKPNMTEHQVPQRINHIAYDPVNGAIFGNDRLSKSIFRLLSKNDEIQHIMNISNEYIGDIGFDYYANNLYWSDTHRRSIEIHSLETGEKTVLHFMEEPWDLLLIPEYAIMYVVFKSEGMYHIDKLQMSGVGPRNRIIEDVQGPKISLAYDPELKRVFWADQGTGRIESISVEGTDRKLFRSGLQKPISLAVHGRDIFWTVQNSKQLQWSDKGNKTPDNKSVTLRLSNDAVVVDVMTISGVYNETQHKCRINNGGCSHVCLVAATEYHICSCPPGMILGVDMRTCNRGAACTSDEIRCSDNNACINKMQRCNGIEDCPNGEDEKECYCNCKSCG